MPGASLPSQSEVFLRHISQMCSRVWWASQIMSMSIVVDEGSNPSAYRFRGRAQCPRPNESSAHFTAVVISFH